MSKTTADNKIPAKFLPKDWREQGAEKFGCSGKTIERVRYAKFESLSAGDLEIFAFLVGLAESKKLEAQNIIDRLATLSQ